MQFYRIKNPIAYICPAKGKTINQNRRIEQLEHTLDYTYARKKRSTNRLLIQVQQLFTKINTNSKLESFFFPSLPQKKKTSSSLKEETSSFSHTITTHLEEVETLSIHSSHRGNRAPSTILLSTRADGRQGEIQKARKSR